jgi:hypothetical protein
MDAVVVEILGMYPGVDPEILRRYYGVNCGD